ncbi:hypothetical protein F5X68DRAFT_235216 [Plectosphaerella plurivora]|uniref:Uncharacterized protein n=1 Tax=Plectosphaerella plurivora TaxID=936078 RepID=A0A9P8V5M7_9PEZI|nr:hypothetical protein F5X68DRAFT_235216 [Plectosphaerella plurivora]
MCFENIAKCEFCNFERPISWDHCPLWRINYMQDYMGNLTGVFSDPPIPKPEDCPKRFQGVVIPIRPGSCPSGPPPAFVREERLRRLAYLRNFGYPDDTDDEDDDDEDAPFGIRGSAINGCVGYEVRARLMQGQEWRDNWSHRNIRHRLGLRPCAPAVDRKIRPPKPIILLPLPASDLEDLKEGEKPSENRKVELPREVVPRPEGIAWTHKLHRPVYLLRRGITGSDSDGDSVTTDGSVAVDAGTAPSPVPLPISPQPQRRRQGQPVNGIRDNIDLNDLLLPRMAEPKPRGRQRERDPSPVPAEDKKEIVIEPGAVLFEGVPFQRPRSYSPRLYWGVPRNLMRRRYAEEEAAIIAKIKAEGGVPFEPTYPPEPPAVPIPIRNPRKRERLPPPDSYFSWH